VAATVGTELEGGADGVFAVVDVDRPHPVRRAAAAIRTIVFLMALSYFARVFGG